MAMDAASAMKALIANFNGDVAAAMRALKESVPKVEKHAAVNKLLDECVAKCGEKMSKKVYKRLALEAWDRAHPVSEDSEVTKEVKPRKPNVWFAFRDTNIAEVKAKYPDMTREERMKVLSEMYQASKAPEAPMVPELIEEEDLDVPELSELIDELQTETETETETETLMEVKHKSKSKRSTPKSTVDEPYPKRMCTRRSAKP
jgi:hypothetical protein